MSFDLEGGNRIPRAAERQARSVAERAAGIGVRRVLLTHDGTLASHDVFEWLLTMLVPDVDLDFVAVSPAQIAQRRSSGHSAPRSASSRTVGPKLKVLDYDPHTGQAIVATRTRAITI